MHKYKVLRGGMNAKRAIPCAVLCRYFENAALQQHFSKKSRKVAMAQLLQASSSIYVMCVCVYVRVLRLHAA
jgi:hypothetical protein